MPPPSLATTHDNCLHRVSPNPHRRAMSNKLSRYASLGKLLSNSLYHTVLMLCLVLGAVACKESPRLPNPVESKDGFSYIPIDDTAFLIPEKTWLRGYGHNSTDGRVASITLHATVPDVQPWSQARHEEMYWPAGPGKKLEIYIKGGGSRAPDFYVSRSKRPPGEFIEEPSDQAAQMLRRFRRLWLPYNEENSEKDTAQFGAELVEAMRRDAGTPQMDTVYYEFIERERVKYFIYCSDSKGGLFQSCHLLIPWTPTVMVDVLFVRDHIRDIVAMADKLSDRLREFEIAGLAYRATKSKSETLPTRQ